MQWTFVCMCACVHVRGFVPGGCSYLYWTQICSQADVVIAALGQAEMVRGDWIKPGAVVIDVGINFVDDDTRKTGNVAA